MTFSEIRCQEKNVELGEGAVNENMCVKIWGLKPISAFTCINVKMPVPDMSACDPRKALRFP